MLKELSNEEIAVDIEDSIRMNVSAMAVQVFIGGEHEKQSIINMTRLDVVINIVRYAGFHQVFAQRLYANVKLRRLLGRPNTPIDLRVAKGVWP